MKKTANTHAKALETATVIRDRLELAAQELAGALHIAKTDWGEADIFVADWSPRLRDLREIISELSKNIDAEVAR
jgi:hypothetical protein